MTDFILALVLLILACLATVADKTYFALPLVELKRRARNKDKSAAALYRAAANGTSLKILLGSFIVLSSALAFALLSKVAPIGYDFVAIVLLIALVYNWLPNSRQGRLSTKLTVISTPLIAAVINYLHPLLSRVAAHTDKRQAHHQHTGIYERDDMLKLIDRQESQADNRLSEQELDLLRRAFLFSEENVGSLMTPLSKLKTVDGNEIVGPILIDELHKTGQPYVLISGESKKQLIGSLSVNKLGLHSSGKIKDHMDSPLAYIYEKDHLSSVLSAFFTTHRPIYVVINSEAEELGVLSVRTVIEQLTGQHFDEDFDAYSGPESVVQHYAASQQVEAEPSLETEPKQEETIAPDPEVLDDEQEFESVEVD